MRTAVVILAAGLLFGCGKKVDPVAAQDSSCYDVTVISSDKESTLVEQYTARDGKRTRFHRRGFLGQPGEAFQLCDAVIR